MPILEALHRRYRPTPLFVITVGLQSVPTSAPLLVYTTLPLRLSTVHGRPFLRASQQIRHALRMT
jgi:hypothetical protein